MVAAEGRKLELDAELLKDVDLIHNNGRLLSEMLANANRYFILWLYSYILFLTNVSQKPNLQNFVERQKSRCY